MVWIHGGGFMQGCGNGETYLYGPGYILDRDVVLVTINYRLTAFGHFDACRYYYISPLKLGLIIVQDS